MKKHRQNNHIMLQMYSWNWKHKPHDWHSWRDCESAWPS